MEVIDSFTRDIIVTKNEELIWSDGMSINLYSDFIEVETSFIKTIPKDDEDLLCGFIEKTVDYRLIVRKSSIDDIVVQYDSNEMYSVTIGYNYSSLGLNARNKKEAHELYGRLKRWLVK